MRISVLLAFAVLAAFPASIAAAGAEATDTPLAPFAPFIGGQWHLDSGYMELEWGVGRQSVIARSYFTVDGESTLVSEGLWYWHPGENKIRGVFTAINMPVALFLYTTRFEGETMIGDLLAYGPDGEATEYVETWAFQDDSRFVWTLFDKTAEGLEESMGATYTRQR